MTIRYSPRRRSSSEARRCHAALAAGSARRVRRRTAASGGGGELKDVLNFSNWPYYMDTKGKKHPTLDQFKAETGITVNYFEDDQLERRVLREDPGPALAGPGDRPRHLRRDGQLAVPGLYVDEGWVQKLDKDLIPNIGNLIDAQASRRSSTRIATYSLPGCRA